jgi:hypothetical protein
MSLSLRFTRTLISCLPVVAPLLVVLSTQEAFAQDIDAMTKWTAATVIHYSVVGEFSGETWIMSFERTFPVSDSAQVTDRVEVEFATIVEWKELPYPMAGIGLVIRRDYPGGAIPHPPPETGSKPCGHRWDSIAASSETYEGGVGAPPAMALPLHRPSPASAFAWR